MHAINPTGFAPTYKAHWPKALDPELQSICTKVSNAFWTIVTTLLYPLWALIGFIYRNAYHAILPPRSSRSESELQKNGDHLLSKHNGQKIKVTTPDGLSLEGALYKGSKHPKKAILYAFGRSKDWESCDYPTHLLTQTGANVLILNHRTNDHGVPDEKGFALDVWSAFNYLVAHGFDPEDIVTIGQSMGGARTAVGLKLVQEQYPDKKINCINTRSMSTLSRELFYLLKKEFVNLTCNVIPECIAKILGYIIAFAASVGFWFIGGDVDAQSALLTLKGKICIVHNPYDSIIPAEAQMITALKGEQRNFVSIEMDKVPGEDGVTAHIRGYNDREKKLLFDQIGEMLKVRL